MRPALLFASAGVLALALAGCGLKGPLYLPEKSAAVVTAPASAPAAAASPAEVPATTAPAPGAPPPQKKTGESQDPQPPQ